MVMAAEINHAIRIRALPMFDVISKTAPGVNVPLFHYFLKQKLIRIANFID